MNKFHIFFFFVCIAAALQSAAAQSDLPAPGALSANTYQDAVRISWTAPQASADRIATLQGYNVYRDGECLNPSPISALYYIDAQAVEATSYSYQVTAVYSAGESSPTESVSVEVPRNGAPVNVVAAIAPDGIDISWDALSQYPSSIKPVVEDFERYDPTSQKILYEMLDGWTMYNGEPERNHKYTEDSPWGIRKDSDGNIYLSGSYINGYTPALNDWIISPLLSPSAQTITLRASKSYAQYPESFAIKCSTSTNSVDSFIDLPDAAVSDSELSTEWREFSFSLPEGTRYFAVVCTSKEGDRLKLDDISYIPAAHPSDAPQRVLGSLVGYNVFVNGAKVNAQPVADTHYIHSPGHTGDFVVTVSGVYSTYETPQSAEALLSVDATKVVLPAILPETFTQREELGNIHLSWEEPLRPNATTVGHEDFDSYPRGAFTSLASGFTAINRSGAKHDDLGYNPFTISIDGGETFLYTSCAPSGIDDWFISPLFKNIKHVSFKAIAENQFDERVELYCSAKDSADPADFTLVKTFTLPKYTSGADWVVCEAQMPESTCRFALRACTPIYGNGIRIDNIEWTCEADLIVSNPQGYHLYHRISPHAGVGTPRHAAPEGYTHLEDYEYNTWRSERGIEVHYVTSTAGTHQFAASAQYPWGESEPSYIEDLVVTGIESVGIDTEKQHSKPLYYTVDGRQINNPEKGQIVIIRTPFSTRKVVW